MKTKEIISLIVAIITCEAAGIVGSIFTASKIPTWYKGLMKPALNPPSWVFGPVWTTLYLLMGIALYIIWKKGLSTEGVKFALTIFAVQLILNALWMEGLWQITQHYLDIVLLEDCFRLLLTF